MKDHVILAGICFGLILSMAVTPGCSSTGTHRAEKTVASADALHKEFGNLKNQIDKTVEALDGVVAAKSSGLRPAYDRYVSEFENLKSQTGVVVDRAEDLRANTKAYVDAWKDQMAEVKNPEIRKHAEERLTQAEQRLGEARDELARIKKDFEKFMGELKEINIVLENDLNPSGVESLESIIQTAKSDSEPVKEDIGTIMGALDEISKAMSAGATEG